MAGHVAVVNAGGFGTALAVLLATSGQEVRLWCRRAEQARLLEASRQNTAYLPNVTIPPQVRATASLREAVDGARAVMLVPISRALRETSTAVAACLPQDVPVLHATKGLELSTLRRLSEVVVEELRTDRVAVLSGPTHAEEVGCGMPTAAVIASARPDVATTFQDLLHGPTFRAYTSADVVGVELCGALKNVVALATGASDGLGYGDNARAALITRSLVEISRLVHAAGGDARTVAGLAGLGDVVATCTSQHSRNRWAGEQIGRGRAVAEIVSSTPKVIEGIPATAAAVALGRLYGVELPVCAQVDKVLHRGLSPRDAVGALMGREARVELSG
jgi:glycerol-3-phosphate dehydrogenase (NAD(P)+)